VGSAGPSPKAPRSIEAPAAATIAATRGRPTPERAAAIDAAIREAALAVFLGAGFDAATMEAVAQRAQVSKGTLYARYESKEHLFRAVIENEIGRWSDRESARDHLLPVEFGPRLRQLARTLIEVCDRPEYARLTKLIQAAMNTVPSLGAEWEELGSNRYLRFLADDMARTAGDVAADWDFLARLFFFAITGWQRNALALGRVDESAAVAFADQIVALVERAVDEAAPR
jgi:AcrR family transcriptional regulator